MPKIMEYEHEYSFLDDDVLLKDGENGTHIITAKDAGLALLNLTNGSEVFYAVCTTSGSTQEKTISLTDFTLHTGSAVVVGFASTNSVAAPTLKINDYEAININYEGGPIEANLLLESHSYLMIYDGSVFVVVGDIADSFLKNYVRIDSIVDDLESDATDAPLSAAQGKELKQLIDEAINKVDGAAPTYHASEEKIYGLGTEDLFGHVKLTESYTVSAGEGAAVSSAAIVNMYKALNSALNDLQDTIERGVVSGKILGDEETLEDYALNFDKGDVFIFSIPEGHESNPADSGIFLGIGLKLVSLEDAADGEKAAIFVGHSDEVDGFYYGYATYVEKEEDEVIYYDLEIEWVLDDFDAKVGTVTTGEAGSSAKVENSGTLKHVVLDFTIPKGDKGDKGDPFTIAKTYSSVAEMEADFDNPDVLEGSFVMIDTGDVEDPDDSKLYVKSATGFDFITDLSGAQGIKGEAATLELGTYETGDPGTEVYISNSGDNTHAVFNFTIPRGDKGEQGDQGETGKAATIEVGTVTTGDEAAVYNSGTENDAVFDFTLPRPDMIFVDDTTKVRYRLGIDNGLAYIEEVDD